MSKPGAVVERVDSGDMLRRRSGSLLVRFLLLALVGAALLVCGALIWRGV